MRVVPCFVLVAATAVGCAEDLGTCQMDAARQVVYASDGTPYYAGQGLVQAACADGVCHSVFAENASRRGAPHGLNFDVSPLGTTAQALNVDALRNGLAQVRDHAGGMWGEIAAGTMPPGEAGKRAPKDWKQSNGMPSGLPELNTDIGQATVRNWLACGAPVVSGVPMAPAAAASLGDTVEPLATSSNGATFDAVFDSVLSNCRTCHDGSVIKVGLDFTTKDMAFATLVDKAPSTDSAGKCGSSTLKLVTPGKCQESLLYLKLAPNPPCGDRMPLGPALSDAAIQTVCDWIDAGATK
jgi:hypothetical protein